MTLHKKLSKVLSMRLLSNRTVNTVVGGLLLIAISVATLSATTATASQDQEPNGRSVNIWWPLQNAQLTGSQPFKAELQGASLSDYRMYWSVDSGTWNPMESSLEGYPHKIAMVDTAHWNWKGNGPYTITYTATDLTGTILMQKNFLLNVGSASVLSMVGVSNDDPANTPVKTLPTTSENPEVSLPAPAPSVANPPTTAAIPLPASPPAPPIVELPAGALANFKLFVQPESRAATQAKDWSQSRPADAARMERLASQPSAKWLGGWNRNVESETRSHVSDAQQAQTVATLVAYNIPQRDCGSHSAGGSATGEAYLEWIRSVSRGIGSNPAMVILEPDALGGIDCLSASDRTLRLKLLAGAVAILKQQPATRVYIDGGHPRWHKSYEMAARLQAANIGQADGFSLNISNFITTQENVEYGTNVSAKLNGKHFVIDTSRNGSGPSQDSQWCNPAGRSVGQSPTTNTGSTVVDAYLWLKTPGESDGACNGGAGAGSWWSEYALGLAKRAGW